MGLYLVLLWLVFYKFGLNSFNLILKLKFKFYYAYLYVLSFSYFYFFFKSIFFSLQFFQSNFKLLLLSFNLWLVFDLIFNNLFHVPCLNYFTLSLNYILSQFVPRFLTFAPLVINLHYKFFNSRIILLNLTLNLLFLHRELFQISFINSLYRDIMRLIQGILLRNSWESLSNKGRIWHISEMFWSIVKSYKIMIRL